jgi:SAM-dependent methyltransferase
MSIDEISATVRQTPLSVEFPGRKHHCGAVGGKIYRVVDSSDQAQLYVELFADEAWMQELFRLGMVATKLIGVDSEGRLVLEHEPFRFQTMAQEWTIGQAREAATTIIRIQRHLMAKDCFLSDPHVFNLTFDSTRPVYFDFGSIAKGPYPEQEWLRNFWLGQTWMESWMTRLGISYATTQDLICHPSYRDLDTQIKKIENMSLRDSPITEWSRYCWQMLDVNNHDSWKEKHLAVEILLSKLQRLPAALDIGCNVGDFCRMMLKLGAVDAVCGMDIDEISIQALNTKAKEDHLPITTAVWDAMTLQGWHVVDFDTESWNRMYQPSVRLQAPLVLAVAMIHHWCYFRDLTFRQVAQVLAEYSQRWLMIEWIPYSDRCLTGKTNRSGVDKSHYTEEEFLSAFLERFPNIVGMEPSTDGVRKMYLLSKEM